MQGSEEEGRAEGIGKGLAKIPFHQSNLGSCWDKIYLGLLLRLFEFIKLIKKGLLGIIHISWGEIEVILNHSCIWTGHRETWGSRSLVTLDPPLPFLSPTHLPAQTSEPLSFFQQAMPPLTSISFAWIFFFSLPNSLRPKFQILALILLSLWNESRLRILHDGRIASIAILHPSPD